MSAEWLEVAARVEAVDAQAVQVRAQPRLGCVACAEGRGCGGGVLGKLLEKRREALRLPAPSFACAPQQTVWLRLPASTLNQLALWTWGLPSLVLLLVALVLQQWPDWRGGLLTVLLAGLAYGLPKMAAQKLADEGLQIHDTPLQPAGCARGQAAA